MCIAVVPAWSAELTPKTLLIADTGFSSVDPIIASHTVGQICIMDWYACPDGSNFQESGTAAVLTPTQLSASGFDHGSKMARAAINAYPDVKLILVRIIAQSQSGARLSASESVVTKVLTWARKNAATFNIGAIAISQGSNKVGTNDRRCLNSPATAQEVSALRAKGIYTFFPVGNEGRTDVINWPACISDAVAVGAIDKSGKIASYSNFAPGQVDLYEPGYAMDSADSGSSYSVQYAAAHWLSLLNRFPTLRPTLVYWSYAFSGGPISNAKGLAGWSTNLDQAIAALDIRQP
jgi:hypothetical protein